MPKSINPTTGQIIQSYPETTEAQLHEKLEAAQKAFLEWRTCSFEQRGQVLLSVANSLLKQKESFAKLMALEIGKPLSNGIFEIEKCATTCEYFAKNATNFLKTEMLQTEAKESFVTFQPLGIVLGIMPWNFPFWQVFRFAVSAIMAGNICILKHASNVSGCATAIEALFQNAGTPLLTSALIRGEKVEALIKHPAIAGVAFTGSTAVGKQVARAAAESLKKHVLELGGSDPYLILEDANLEFAAHACVQGRLNNAGQSCISPKRFIVLKSVQKTFEKLVVEQMQKAKMGDPLNPSTTLGPLARFDLRDELHTQVKNSILKGARCLFGGEIPDLPGAFYPPTILTNVKPGMPAYAEELFGPVASIIPVSNELDAIRVANDASFGLGAGVFTKNLDRGKKIAQCLLEAGSATVNNIVHSDPRVPFGGTKSSGYGRELGTYGIKEFVNIKAVCVY